jgi:hypothetical protein
MFTRSYRIFLGTTTMMVLSTWLIAWWTVPVVAAVYGYLARREPWSPLRAAIAGFTSWSILLLVQAQGGGIGRIADAVGGVIGVGAFGVTALTLLFPTLLAASAAALVRAVALTRLS